MHIGYIITIAFFVIWLIFKLIEVTKERNKQKDTDKKDQ